MLLPVAVVSVLASICRPGAGEYGARESGPVRLSTGIAHGANRRPAPPAVVLDTTEPRFSGRKIAVPGGASASRDFQTALEQASPGDVIELRAGAVFSGNFTLPNKTAVPQAKIASRGAEWITIRSSARESELPPPGIRISPSFSSFMPKLITPNADPVLKTAKSAHHFRLVGIEFAALAGARVNNLIKLGDGDESEIASLPHDITIDRCFIHGDSAAELRRGIALNSASTAVIDSYISDCHQVGTDSQAICGWNGPGPFKIVNNYLEAAGENVMFGGADPSIKDLVPSDIEFRQNHCSKPLKWKPGDAAYQGTRWSVKNIFELKNAQRVLIEGNLFENVWQDAQTGYAILFKSINQDGRAPWCVTRDVEFKNNVVRHCGGGINIQGTSPNQMGGRTRRINIENNIFDDVNKTLWGGDGAFLKITESEDIRIDHNTAMHTGNIVTAYGPPSDGFVFTNNLVQHNQYGVKGDNTGAGSETLEKFFPACIFKKNLIIGVREARYPNDNFIVIAVDRVGLLSGSGKNFRLATSSRYKNAGTDGRDVGCDVDLLPPGLAD